MAASTAFYQSLNFFKDGISYVNDLNKSLTEISIVTGQTQEQVAALGEEYNRLAQNMGVLTKDIAQATVEFYRQGLSQEEVMNRTAVATQYAKISALDFKRSAEILTATVNSMGVDITRASDVFSYLGDATATGADEIGIAFQRVGGTAGAVNLEFEKAASWIAVLSSRTREGAATIGNSIKSILARVQSMKETGFSEEDGTSVNQVAKALDAVNIKLVDNEGNFRNFGTVMDELGSKWVDLDNRTKAYLATTIAGTYQQSRFLNLMEGYQDTIPLYEKALASAGTTTEKFALYQQGTEAQLNKLKATWEGLWTASFDSETIRLVVASFNTMATVLKNTVESFGLLPPILGIAGVSILAFNGGLQRMVANGALVLTTLRGIPLGLKNIDSALALTTLRMNAATASTRVLTTSLNALKTASVTATRFLAGAALPFAAFALIGTAIGKATEKINEYKTKQEELKKQSEDIRSSYVANGDEINRLVQKYELLNSKVTSGQISKSNEEYVSTANRLNEIFPILTHHVDEQGNAHLRNVEQIKQEVEYAEQLKDNYAQMNVASFEKSLDEQKKKFDDLVKEANRLQKATSSGYATYNESANLQAQRELIQSERELQLLVQNSKDYILEKSNAFLDLSGASQNLSEENKKLIDDFIQQQISLADVTAEGFNFEDFLKNLVNTATDLGEELASIPSPLKAMFDGDDVEGMTDNQLGVMKSINESVKSGYTEWENYRKILEMVGFKNVDEIIGRLTGTIKDNTKALENNEAQAKEYVKNFDDSISKIESLNSVLNDLNEDHTISSDTISKLMESYDHLLPYINDEATLRAKVAEEIQKEEKIAKQAMLGKLQYNETFYKAAIAANTKQVQAFQKMYGVDLKAYKSLGEAKVAVENKVLGAVMGAWESHQEKLVAMTKVAMMTGNPMAQGLGMALGALKDQATTVQTSFDDIFLDQVDLMTDSAIATSGLTDETKKSNKETENSIYITDKYKQSIEAVRLELEKQQAIKAKFPTYSKQYQTALKNEISLLEKQKKLIQDQAKSLEKQIKSGNIIQPGISTTSSSSVSTASTMATGSSTAAQIWNFFKSKGFSDSIVAGIMGNLKLESGLNPNAINKSSGATGIAQWLGGRKSALSSYAGSMGTSMYDLNTQLNFLWKELNSTEKRTMSYLSANQNASAAQVAAMFDKLFERSEGTHIPQRQAYANQFLSQFSGTGVSVSASSTVSDTSKAIAEQMQSIDGAKSDLTSLKTELLNLEAEIAQKQMELLKLPIDIYEKRIADQDKNIQNTTNSLYNLSEGTSEYGFKLRQLIAYYKEKQTQNEKEINYMRQLIASGKLSAVQVAEVSEQLQGLIDRRYEIAQGRDEINAQIVTNALHKYAKAIEDVNYNLELSRSIQELYVEGSEKYNAETVNQSKLLREKQKLIVDEINKLDELLKKQDLSIESSEEYSNQLKQLKLDLQNLNNELNRSLVDQLSKLRDKQIEGINDYYDTLIERQEERLNQLDEEIEKEDRLQKLREIDDEISKVKNDKRFSYITSEGKEILTYNQERVSELEKQRNEMLEQYQREDLKKAINDEIDRLRKAKDDIVRNEEEKWKSVLESAQNGTLNLDSFMQQWYGMNLDVMGDYATQLNSQVSVIKEIFKSLASIKVSLPGVPGLNGSDNPFGMSEADFNKYVQNKKTYESGASGASKAAIENQKLREKYDVGTDNFNYDQLKKYHDGGVVGQSHGSRLAEMVNRLGNHKLKPGELFTKSLVGEVQIPPKNFSNLFANIGTLMNSLTPNVPSIVSPQGDTYHIHNATIKADNPSELWKGIQMQTRMNRK